MLEPEKFEGTAVKQYLRYRPPGVSNPAILLFLHGRGESAVNGLDALKRHGTPVARCDQPGWRHGFLIVAPQLPTSESRWHRHVEELEALIEKVRADCHAATGALYGTGFSIGGLGIVALAATSRKLRFTRLLPVDAYNPEPQWDFQVRNPAGIGTPVWSHHNSTNTVAPRAARLLDSTTTPSTYAAAPGESGRDIHTRICREAYAQDGVYDWLLTGRR